jgi:Lrp/AsnC family transcriptional regulator, leucine-responsive regulatory protein
MDIIFIMIDETDTKILNLLQDNCRLSNAELAEAVGMNASSVFERVKKLERKGIITGYVATVDAEKLGKPLLAFMRITVDTSAQEDFHSIHGRILKAVQGEPDILECHNVAGEDCFIIKVRAEGPKKLERLLAKIRYLTHGTRSVTNIVLSTYKESTKVEPESENQIHE